jgi:hypothetical protein
VDQVYEQDGLQPGVVDDDLASELADVVFQDEALSGVADAEEADDLAFTVRSVIDRDVCVSTSSPRRRKLDT